MKKLVAVFLSAILKRRMYGDVVIFVCLSVRSFVCAALQKENIVLEN